MWIWVAICAFETLMMILGTSVANAFASHVFVQVCFHFVGVLFTLWFILDDWRWPQLYWLICVFGGVPLIFEVIMLLGAISMTIEVKKNLGM